MYTNWLYPLLSIMLMTSCLFTPKQMDSFVPTASNNHIKAYETFDVLFLDDSNGYRNNIGTIKIDSIDVKIDLYEILDGEENNAQTAIDNDKTAVFLNYSWLPQPIICDHDYQAFENLGLVELGDICEITSWKYGTKTFKCTNIEPGFNKHSEIVNQEGTAYSSVHVGDLVLYTCAEGNSAITLTTWEEIEE